MGEEGDSSAGKCVHYNRGCSFVVSTKHCCLVQVSCPDRFVNGRHAAQVNTPIMWVVL